tara:strand:+ start:961 stop:1278 length:318 start_codon:yes stop_codon:yes gene_type:complete
MKSLFFIILILATFGCQRDKMSDVGVGYNKTLIIPPSDDLPDPGTKDQGDSSENYLSKTTLLKKILDQTEATKTDDSIIDKIDDQSGYKTDENFFQWLFKGKSKR